MKQMENRQKIKVKSIKEELHSSLRVFTADVPYSQHTQQELGHATSLWGTPRMWSWSRAKLAWLLGAGMWLHCYSLCAFTFSQNPA